MEMYFHGNQLSWRIKHPFISLYFKYHSSGFICLFSMLAPVISSLDGINCMIMNEMTSKMSDEQDEFMILRDGFIRFYTFSLIFNSGMTNQPTYRASYRGAVVHLKRYNIVHTLWKFNHNYESFCVFASSSLVTSIYWLVYCQLRSQLLPRSHRSRSVPTMQKRRSRRKWCRHWHRPIPWQSHQEAHGQTQGRLRQCRMSLERNSAWFLSTWRIMSSGFSSMSSSRMQCRIAKVIT